jgi:hypothetical protein
MRTRLGQTVQSYDSRPEFLSYDDQSPDAEFTDDEALLFSSIIRSFDIGTQKSLLVSITDLHPIDWNKSAMNHLVLADEKKDLIRDLMASHIKGTSSKTQDIIQGKGSVSASYELCNASNPP